jgi:hypothetical protein
MQLALALAAVTLTLHLHAGDRIIEHAYSLDRIQWILPQARLEAMRRGGAVIQEEFHTTSSADETVVAAFGGHALVRGHVEVTTLDVPRAKTAKDTATRTASVAADNTTSGRYDIADAPMVAFPHTPVALGTKWSTRLLVITPLGSGVARFVHRVSQIDSDLVRVDVSGTGTITGKEYNLPKLLPGTIALQGSAWYSLSQGIVVRESYRIENTIIKPAGAEQIGFREVLYTETDAHKAGRRAP